MTKNKKLVLLIALVAALLIGTVITASAVSATKKMCYTQNFGGVAVAKACVKATFTTSGSLVKCSSPSKTITVYDPLFSVTTVTAPYCSPTGYSTYAGVYGRFQFKRLGVTLSQKMLSEVCHVSGGALSCVGYADNY